MHQPKLRVLICLRNEAVSSGVSDALRHIADCVVSVGLDGAIDAICRHQFDLCLLDADPEGDWTGEMKLIQQSRPGIRVILMSPAPKKDEFRRAIRAGAAGYLSVGVDKTQLVRDVESVVNGRATVPLAFLRGLIDDGSFGGLDIIMADGRQVSLSGRETEVLNLLREKADTKTIARQLGISPVTVRRHRSSLLAKLGGLALEALLAKIDGGSVTVRSG
jgi:DNA-binding NarL/FixJ family response regulator